MATIKTMASTAKKSAKTIAMNIWERAPKSVKQFGESAIIVSMAAGLLSATTMDECGKQAVKDMAQELEYTWDPFDGILA